MPHRLVLSLPALLTRPRSYLGKSWFLLNIYLYLLPSTFVYKLCVALGHREEKKKQLISDLVMALDSLLKLFILRHFISGCCLIH